GASFVSASGLVTPTGGIVSWPLGTLAAGATASKQLTVTATAGTGIVTGMANVVDASSTQSYARAALPSNVGAVNPIAIGVSSFPAPAAPGQVVTFAMDLSNPTLSGENSLTIRARVPDGTTVNAAQAAGASCSGGGWPCLPGQVLTWYPV